MTPSPSEELLAQLLVNVSALTSEVMQLKTCVVQRDKAATTMAKEMVELKRELKGLAKSSKDSAKASTKSLAGIPNIEKAVVYVRKHTKKVRST
jgi:seryl-tRNA synthetase